MKNEFHTKLYEKLLFIEKLVEIFHVEPEDADMMLDYLENGHSLRDAYHHTLDLIDNGECEEDGQENKEDSSNY